MTSRRLAALMFTDMVGYSAIAHKNELLARELVDEQRKLVRDALVRHDGHEHDTAGDGFFIEFASAVSAVECAVEIQNLIFDRNRFAAPERKMQLRIGIHLGDVVTNGQGLFGNGVNLAARIEPLAPAGGVCITQQIFDQVDGKIGGLKYKKQGHRKLKNIASGATIYSVITPWNRVADSSVQNWSRRLATLPIFENMSSILGGGLFSVCGLLLAIATYSSFSFHSSARPYSSRAPASLSSLASANAPSRVDLSQGWTYQLAKDSHAPSWIQTPNESGWQPFNTKSTWTYSELIRGPYWLKKTLSGKTDLATPAIVLGLIGDRHRVYLNDHFIGGADQAGELAVYPFDPQLLHEGSNTLIIASESRPSLNPGLVTLGGVGAFLGDFTEARDAVAKNQLQFGLLRNIYFAFSLFIFAVAFAYALFKRSSRSFFYYAFVLLLGSVQLAYFNPSLTMAFSYPFLRFLKAIGLTLTPLVLFSSYLAGQEKRRAEVWTNAAATFVTAAIALAFFKLSHDTLQFMDAFNAALVVGFVFNVAVIVGIAVEVFKQRKAIALHAFYLVFELISVVTLLASFKRGLSEALLPTGIRDSVFALTLASPLLFALSVVVIAVVDHIKQSHIARTQKARDEFALNILHSIHESEGSRQAAFEIHAKLAKFLTASRSTIYLVADTSGQSLDVFHSLGDQTANGTVAAGAIAPHKVLQHVLDTNTPVLVQDIATDLRFPERQSARETSSYETRSCIVIPLRTLGKVIGLITFADKADKTAFTNDDFRAAIEIASTLSLLLPETQRRAPVALFPGPERRRQIA